MQGVTVTTLGGGPAKLAITELRPLQRNMRGKVCLRGDAGYDEARTIWNAMIDRRPGVVLRCACAEDVVAGVRFARDQHLLLAVRAGGHHIAGSAVCDGGLLLDLSPMRGVSVDTERREACAEGGALLADVDQATQGFGLAVPLGINSTTGVAGLTLGGGYGWLTRRLGMTVDNLLAADLVIASGELIEVSGRREPELFWAVRGGGGNFGVATAFRFRVHPVGPQVLAGLIVHPFARARDLLDTFRQVAAVAPEELTCMAVIRKAPPLPFLPKHVHGQIVLTFAICHVGDAGEAERALAPLRSAPAPIADTVGPQPYAGWQAAFDPLLAPGARNYWKSHDLEQLDDGLLDAIVAHAAVLPTAESEVFLPSFGGAMGRVPSDAMAFPHRRMRFLLNVHARWRDPAADADCVAWARSFAAAVASFGTGGAYVNFMPGDETDRLRGAFGANLPRLRALKARYDPANQFRCNHNVPPAS